MPRLAVILLCAFAACSAQERKATLNGSMQDGTGVRVPGVWVSLVAPGTQNKRVEARADKSGPSRFRKCRRGPTTCGSISLRVRKKESKKKRELDFSRGGVACDANGARWLAHQNFNEDLLHAMRRRFRRALALPRRVARGYLAFGETAGCAPRTKKPQVPAKGA